MVGFGFWVLFVLLLDLQLMVVSLISSLSRVNREVCLAMAEISRYPSLLPITGKVEGPTARAASAAPAKQDKDHALWRENSLRRLFTIGHM